MQKRIMVVLLFIMATIPLGAASYSLDQCVEEALENNLSIKQKELDLKKYENKVNQAYSNLFPSVSLTSGISSTIEPEKMSITIPDPSSTIPDAGMIIFTDYPDWGFRHSISIQQILFSAQAILGVKLARLQRKVEELNLELEKRKVRSQVERAYYGILMTEKVIRITEHSLSQDESHLDIARKKSGQGLVSDFDVLRSEVKTKSTRNSLVSAKNANQMAKLGLFLMMNRDYDDDAEFTGDFGYIVEIPSIERSIELAHKNRLELKILDYTLDVFKNLVRLYRASYYPMLALQGDFSHVYGSNNASDYFSVSDFSKSYSVAVGLQWTLFDGLNRLNQVNEAKNDLKKMILQNELAIDGIKAEIRQVHWTLEQNKVEYETALSSLKEAEKLIEIANVQYEEGLITFVELNDAQLAYDATQLKLYQSLYNYNVALSNYKLAIGN